MPSRGPGVGHAADCRGGQSGSSSSVSHAAFGAACAPSRVGAVPPGVRAVSRGRRYGDPPSPLLSREEKLLTSDHAHDPFPVAIDDSVAARPVLAGEVRRFLEGYEGALRVGKLSPVPEIPVRIVQLGPAKGRKLRAASLDVSHNEMRLPWIGATDKASHQVALILTFSAGV